MVVLEVMLVNDDVGGLGCRTILSSRCRLHRVEKMNGDLRKGERRAPTAHGTAHSEYERAKGRKSLMLTVFR